MVSLFKINIVKKIVALGLCLFILISFKAEACPTPLHKPELINTCALMNAEGVVPSNTALVALDGQIKALETTIPQTLKARNDVSDFNMESMLAKFQYAFVENIKDLGTDVIESGLKPMAAQMVASKMLANVQNAKAEDMKNIQRTDAKKQQRNFDVIQAYKPSPQDFRFDSKGIYLKIGDKFRRSSSTFLAKIFSELGSNKEGYSSKDGPLGLLNKRWETFQMFCDPQAGKGFTGCENPDGSDLNRVNLHIMPSKAIFIKSTIDFDNESEDNPYLMSGLKELVFNLTGFSSMSSIESGALSSTSGRSQLINSRAYLAQMDAVNSMIYTIMGERFPTPLDEHMPNGENPIKQIRDFLGVADASNRPSFYEARQSFVEELRSPEYYLDLVDNKNTIERKEVYLRAYGLMLLNQLIEKQEKISNAYAIETANLLQQSSVLSDTATSSLATGGGR